MNIIIRMRDTVVKYRTLGAIVLMLGVIPVILYVIHPRATSPSTKNFLTNFQKKISHTKQIKLAWKNTWISSNDYPTFENNQIYAKVGNWDHILLLDQKSGKLQFEYHSDNPITTLVMDNDIMYSITDKRELRAMTMYPQHVLWQISLPSTKLDEAREKSFETNMQITYDDRIFNMEMVGHTLVIDDSNHFILGFDPKTGTEKWRIQKQSSCTNGIFIIPHVPLYECQSGFTTTPQSTLYYFNPDTGRQKATIQKEGVFTALGILEKNIAYVSYTNPFMFDNPTPSKGYVLALDLLTGDTRWDSETGGGFKRMGIDHDKIIITENDTFLALDKSTGKKLWNSKPFYSGTTQFENLFMPGLTFSTHYGGIFSVIDTKDGETKWTINAKTDYIIPLAYTNQTLLLARGHCLDILTCGDHHTDIYEYTLDGEEVVKTDLGKHHFGNTNTPQIHFIDNLLYLVTSEGLFVYTYQE